MPGNLPDSFDAVFDRGAEEADAIFVGEVVAVAHRVSDIRDQRDMAVPHTFVTFHVERALKGAADGDDVTLRFVGGPTGTGLFLHPPAVPDFVVGDRAVLLARGNASHACPLVDCKHGLFRLSDGGVFTETADAVVVDAAGRLALGPRSDRPELNRVPVGDHYVIRKHTPDAEDARRAALGAPVSVEAFADRIDGAVRARFGDAHLAALPRIASADARTPFFIEKPTPVAVRFVDAPAPEPTDEQDRAEREALARNGNNPVLPQP